MNLKRWAIPMVLMLTVVGSLSACSSDGATPSAAPDGTEPAAQNQDTTSAQTFNMTITGDVQANVTEADLTEQFFCPDFEGVNLDGSATSVDSYWVDFNFTSGGKTWFLNVHVNGGAPGTVPVAATPSGASVRLSSSNKNFMESVHDPETSGTVTIAEDGQSGTVDAVGLGWLGHAVNIEGSWAC